MSKILNSVKNRNNNGKTKENSGTEDHEGNEKWGRPLRGDSSNRISVNSKTVHLRLSSQRRKKNKKTNKDYGIYKATSSETVYAFWQSQKEKSERRKRLLKKWWVKISQILGGIWTSGFTYLKFIKKV